MPSIRHLESSHGHRPTTSLLTPSSACPPQLFVKQNDQSRLRLPNREVAGYGGEEWGTMFFPPGGPEDSFEEFGWPRKQSDSEATASETGDDGSGAGMQGTGTAVE